MEERELSSPSGSSANRGLDLSDGRDASASENIKPTLVDKSGSVKNDLNLSARSKKHSLEKRSDLKAGKKQKQAQLNFSRKDGNGPLSIKLKLGSKNYDRVNSSASLPKAYDLPASLENSSSIEIQSSSSDEDSNDAKLIVKIPLRSIQHYGNSNGVKIVRSKTREIDSHPTAKAQEGSDRDRSKEKTVSRTTVVNTKVKSSRSNPGPLISLNYDLYDDTIIQSSLNKSASCERLAFGFPITPKPFASDISYIIAFLSKFRDIIHVGMMGPADFEEGLGLDSDSSFSNGNPISNSSYVSPLMDLLFRKLLALVLNRKKPIAHDSQRSALQELKSKQMTLGLPQEWRDDLYLDAAANTLSDEREDAGFNRALHDSVGSTTDFESSTELLNPLREVDFEKFGIGGIKSPKDRCIMMRCMVTWCLSESTAVKNAFSEFLSQQDTSGERETVYGSRSIIQGFSQVIDMQKSSDRKGPWKGKSKQSSDVAESPRYFHPTSDPLSHPLHFRLNEFVVSDCGFHVGRFYLVRMADSSSGRVSSLEQLRNYSKKGTAVRSSFPSNFALYVEDVHSSLTHALREFGVEFDMEGNEVARQKENNQSCHWFRVASTCEEVGHFITHLSLRLGLSGDLKESLSPDCVLYEPAIQLYKYLSLMSTILSECESLKADTFNMSRASRRKQRVYATQTVLDGDNEENWDGEIEEMTDEEQDEEYLD